MKARERARKLESASFAYPEKSGRYYVAIVEKPYQEVYIIAQRTIAGVTTYTIERQDFTAIDDPKNSQEGQLCNLDCSYCFNFGFPVGIVSVPLYIGQEVSIVADGAVQPN